MPWNDVLIGSMPPSWFKGDGCSRVPERDEWVDACRWHDWAYDLIRQDRLDGAPKHILKAKRRSADAFFRANLKTLGGPHFLYWIGVRLGGWNPLKRRREPLTKDNPGKGK